MKHKKGFKYQLVEDYSTIISIKPHINITTPFISLSIDGLLIIKKGYAWDGCSGPAWDDKTNQTAGLIHDSLYQLERMGLIDRGSWRLSDKEFDIAAKRNKMNNVRRWAYRLGLSAAHGVAADPKNKKVVYTVGD